MQAELTQKEFQKAAETGAFLKIVLKASWAKFEIVGVTRGGDEARLVPQRFAGGVRQFLNPAAALSLLKRMGIHTVEIQMENWDLEMASLSMRSRPDVVARRLRDRRIQEAAYYPNRPAETGEVSRTDQLGKLIAKRVEEMARPRSG